MKIDLKLNSRREMMYTYISLLYKFHKLTDREIDVTVSIVLSYFDALELYKNKDAADKLYLIKERKEAIAKELGITAQVFRNYISTLKRKGILKEDMTITPIFTPSIEEDGKLLLNFNLSHA